MPEAQEALKEDNIMVDLDTSGNAVDVELKDAKQEIISKFKEIKEMDIFIKSISNTDRSIVR